MPTSLLFERTLQLFFGDKAYQTACVANNPKSQKEWHLKCIKKLKTKVNLLDSTLRHKESLLNDLISLENEIKKGLYDANTVNHFFKFIAHLFGFATSRGASLYTLAYWQDKDQVLTQEIILGDEQKVYAANKNAITLQRQLVKQLKADGVDNYTIAQTLNISEHRVKQLLK